MKRNLSLSLAKTITRNGLFPNYRGNGACLHLDKLSSYATEALLHLGSHYPAVSLAELGFESLSAEDLKTLIPGTCHRLVLTDLSQVDVNLAQAIRSSLGDRGSIRLYVSQPLEIKALEALLDKQSPSAHDIAFNISVPSISDAAVKALSLYAGTLAVRLRDKAPSSQQLETFAKYQGVGLDLKFPDPTPEYLIEKIRETCSPSHSLRVTFSDGETLLELMEKEIAAEMYGREIH